MYGKQGRQSLGNGVSGPIRLDSAGSLVVSSYGKYAEAVLQGKVFVAANQAKVAVTADFATTYTGLVVENPSGSGKNLIMIGFSYAAEELIATAVGIGLMTGADAGDAAAAIVPRNRLKGSGNVSVAIVDNGCTLVGEPVLEQLITTAWTEATTVGTLAQPNVVDLDGSLIVTPGYYVAVNATAAVAASMLFGFMWIEVDAE